MILHPRRARQDTRDLVLALVEPLNTAAVGAEPFELLLHGTPYADCLIAEDENGQPCAYCLLALTWSNEAGGLCVWLEEIMVDDERRGKGIGSRLIAAVHEKYNTAARYRLEVTESNVRASALYHMLGFENLEYRQMILDTPPLG